jgi:hypothetical protein
MGAAGNVIGRWSAAMCRSPGEPCSYKVQGRRIAGSSFHALYRPEASHLDTAIWVIAVGSELVRHGGLSPAGVPDRVDPSEPVTPERWSGEARISFHPDGGWWWIATGADCAHQDAGETPYATQAEAAAMAGVFLKEHAVDKQAASA